MPRYKFSNSVKFSPNPWAPRQNPNMFPARLPYISPREIEMLNQNMCRLCLLFPTIAVENILNILELHRHKLSEAIDTLLYIKTLQMSNQNEQKFFYKNSCARCSPIQKKSLLQKALETRTKADELAILPNITFGPDSTKMSYEHEQNFIQLPSMQNSTVVNIGNKDNTNAKVEVVNPVPNTQEKCGCSICLYNRISTPIFRRRY